MSKVNTKKRVTLVGGNKASQVNPLGVIRLFKSVCITDGGEIISPQWRNTKAEARDDAAEHINKDHHIDYDTKIVKPN